MSLGVKEVPKFNDLGLVLLREELTKGLTDRAISCILFIYNAARLATVEAKASLLHHHANEKPRRRLIVSRGTAVVLRFIFSCALAVTP